MRKREARAGWLFVLPWVIGLLAFNAYPILASFYFSFTDYSIIDLPKWIGLNNYQEILTTDPAFWTSVNNSAYYALISVPLGLIVSLALALILNQNVRGIGLYRTLCNTTPN
jgi:multiple sugar transport system permease protein